MRSYKLKITVSYNKKIYAHYVDIKAQGIVNAIKEGVDHVIEKYIYDEITGINVKRVKEYYENLQC